MIDRPPVTPEFSGASERDRHEQEQRRLLLSDEQRRHVERIEKASKRLYQLRQEKLERTKAQDIEKAIPLVGRESPEHRFTLDGKTTKTLSDAEVRKIATANVEASNAGILAALQQRGKQKVNRRIAIFTADKRQEQAKARDELQRLAEQKRADREATLVDEQKRRVLAHMRKAKKRDDKHRDNEHERE